MTSTQLQHRGFLRVAASSNRLLGVAVESTLMIGDTTHDLQMAKNAGVAALGVTYGAHPREALVALEPHFCADTVAELAQWLRENA